MKASTKYNNRCRDRARARLVQEMGGRCAKENETCRGPLEFDHVDPARKTWVASSVASHMRVARYRADWLIGNLQLLCRAHNARKGKRYGHEAELMAAQAAYVPIETILAEIAAAFAEDDFEAVPF